MRSLNCMLGYKSTHRLIAFTSKNNSLLVCHTFFDKYFLTLLFGHSLSALTLLAPTPRAGFSQRYQDHRPKLTGLSRVLSLQYHDIRRIVYGIDHTLNALTKKNRNHWPQISQ